MTVEATALPQNSQSQLGDESTDGTAWPYLSGDIGGEFLEPRIVSERIRTSDRAAAAQE